MSNAQSSKLISRKKYVIISQKARVCDVHDWSNKNLSELLGSLGKGVRKNIWVLVTGFGRNYMQCKRFCFDKVNHCFLLHWNPLFQLNLINHHVDQMRWKTKYLIWQPIGYTFHTPRFWHGIFRKKKCTNHNPKNPNSNLTFVTFSLTMKEYSISTN